MHIEGSLEAETLVTLARRNGIALPSYDPDVLRARYVFDDLQSFLDIYYEHIAVVRTAEDFYDLGRAYLTRASAAGVRHAEMFVDLQSHTARGIAPAAVFEGLGAAIRDSRADTGISSALILSFLRDLGPEAAASTLSAALPFRDSFIGVGLDSAEVGYPPSLFEAVYRRAAAEGLHRVAHAGEEGGPDYVWEALDVLGVERIDHGNRAMEDPALVSRLRDAQVPITVCPLSNVALKTGPADLADHILPAMLAEGLLVSINSDDPAYFGGYVDDNFDAIRRSLSFDSGQLAELARNSFESAFLTDAEKAAFIAEIAETADVRS
ncbi:adenosine deaminase [Amnibacterium flavum]|uniref:Adenine deaminase n=2 Tax=Amnibacterium flavum TaxID=2173173 RepID=A0A2V1HT50_9MICO|nr:adenosine deaminase [Amnibacterium flavum]